MKNIKFALLALLILIPNYSFAKNISNNVHLEKVALSKLTPIQKGNSCEVTYSTIGGDTVMDVEMPCDTFIEEMGIKGFKKE